MVCIVRIVSIYYVYECIFSAEKNLSLKKIFKKRGSDTLCVEREKVRGREREQCAFNTSGNNTCNVECFT